eukprot:6384394-Karenia_brevis.AAC.1
MTMTMTMTSCASYAILMTMTSTMTMTLYVQRCAGPPVGQSVEPVGAEQVQAAGSLSQYPNQYPLFLRPPLFSVMILAALGLSTS